jgi:hypothetical protein
MINRLRIALLSSFIIASLLSEAQFVIEASNEVTVLREGGSVFLNPWTGGANAIQLSKFDADFDGEEDDIFLFDRSGNRTLVFLGEFIGEEMTYIYEPDYRTSFPNMRNFSLLRDFDCDGKRDIFTYSALGGAMTVFKNNGGIQGMNWQVESEAVLSFYDFGSTSYTTNIYTSSQDIPAIFDYEADGDLDVMSFNVGGSFIELHINNSIENDGDCGLSYYLANRCYGGFIEGDDSNDIILDPDQVEEECTFNVVDPRDSGGLRHVGSTILTFDGNNDGLHDLVLGDVGFENMVYLENGNPINGPDQIVDFAFDFPANMGTEAVSINNFPAAFYEDVDGDNISDLIVGVNAALGAASENSIHLYLNSGSETEPFFNFVTTSFLQNEMLDWGRHAAPTFFDYNDDGLMDLVIGCTIDQTDEITGVPGLILLENIGTLTDPAFQIVEENWQELNTVSSSTAPAPTFGDFDDDGDSDLVVGFFNGSLHYFENNGGWVYQGLIQTTDGSGNVGNSACPNATDLDGDGKTDLIVGESEGNLNYFKNSGNGEAVFTLITENLGGVNTTMTPPFFEGQSAPYFFEFEDTKYLAVGSRAGKIYQFEVSDPDEVWTEQEEGFDVYTSFTASPYGLDSRPAVMDITNDGIPEVLAGLVTGGVEYFRGAGFLNTSSKLDISDINVKIYPNPAGDVINMEWYAHPDNFHSLNIYSLDGRKVFFSAVLKDSIDISRLSAGTYIVSIESANGVASQILIKK